MANHRSAIKAHRASLKRSKRNTQRVSRIKTFTKKLEAAIVKNDVTDLRAMLSTVESEIMRGVKFGVLKLNAASRKVSQLTKKIKALESV